MTSLKGLSFPVKFTPRGSLQVTEGLDKIKENIKAIASTSVGERVMNPTIGTLGYTQLFRNMDDSSISLIKYYMRTGIEAGEDRVTITDVQVDQPTKDGMLHVSISFRVETTNEFDNLTFYI